MKKLFAILALAILLVSCYGDEHLAWELSGSKKISLNAEIKQVPATRVNDNGFCDGDVIGVYIVDYQGENAGELRSAGNRADNVKYTFDEPNNLWIPEVDIYYKDETTPVDIYGYYPADTLSNVNSYSFTVKQNQSKESANGEMGGYEASDFLWGKATKMAPTISQIIITFQHHMSSVKVEFVKGDGFEESEWNGLEKQMVVKGVKRDCSIDLATGEVTAEGLVSAAGTVPYRKDNSFRAIVVPQKLAPNTELFAISVGGVPYKFVKSEAFEYLQGKMHKFSIRVDKKEFSGEYTFTLAAESVQAWENDDVGHDATMRDYIVVNSTAGGLKDAILAAGYDYRSLCNLKITGEINDFDFYFMRDSMALLENLNLKSVKIERRDVDPYKNVRAIPSAAFMDKSTLNRVVFPDELDVIEGAAFFRSSLTGSLTIPEGVMELGGDAFAYCDKLNGRLTLPSTLRCIGGGAFQGCSNIMGELNLPDGLEDIKAYTFNGCKGLSGRLVLPETIEEIEIMAFYECGFSGDLKIPAKCKKIGSSAFCRDSFNGRLILEEGVEHIGGAAFRECNFIGPLFLPSSLKIIENQGFIYNNFSGDLVLPEGLVALGELAFESSRFTGVLSIPSGISSISTGTFAGCNLEGIVLHEGVVHVGNDAFRGNMMLNSIVSLAEIPPTVGSGAFDGVPKDNFTVEVPEVSVSSYVSSQGWSDFHRIAAHHELVCRPAFAVAINKETKRTLVLNAEGDWEVISKPEWCELSKMQGNKKTELILTIKELASGVPHRQDSIVFKLKDKDYTHTCAVSQYDYQYEEDEVITLQKASKGNTGGVNLVFIGDGYDGKDISEGLYLQDVQMQVENFFAIHPYKAYRDYFNVYTAIAVSPESGTGTVNTINYNKFETTYTGGSGLKCNNEAVFQYVLDMKTPVTEENLNEALIVLLPNASDYGGIAYMWEDGSAIAICPKSNMGYPYDTRGILQHEAGGHGFGKLGDEYIYHNVFIDACGCPCCGHLPEFEHYKSIGWYDNLSSTGKMHQVPWAHLIFDERYSDLVDIYEGGWMHSRGIYRSEYTSCMNNNIAYFSTISRESMVKRIKRYAGEEYSFEEFVANDSRESGTVTKSGTDFVPGISQMQSHCAPVVYSGSPLRTNKN